MQCFLTSFFFAVSLGMNAYERHPYRPLIAFIFVTDYFMFREALGLVQEKRAEI